MYHFKITILLILCITTLIACSNSKEVLEEPDYYSKSADYYPKGEEKMDKVEDEDAKVEIEDTEKNKEINQDSPELKVENKNEENSVNTDLKTFGLNLNEFERKFNQTMKDEWGAPINIKSPYITNNTFVYTIGKLDLMGFLNEDGSIKEIALWLPLETLNQKDTAMFLVSMGGIVSVTNPTLTADERGTILEDLGFMDENVDFATLRSETSRNSTIYKFEEFGFIAEPK